MSDVMSLSSTRATAWDRAVIFTLGGAGSALSYDALQQMAVAIHVRGFLTYLFPLVIDGFIAYGVRALLVLREAPLRARAYVWTLFGTATGASLWANALHAIRLNQLPTASTGLRLSNLVVGVLSTLAPLALAGAVHLYILIARAPISHGDRPDRADRGQHGHRGQTDRRGEAGQVSAGHQVAALTEDAGQGNGTADRVGQQGAVLTGTAAQDSRSVRTVDRVGQLVTFRTVHTAPVRDTRVRTARGRAPRVRTPRVRVPRTVAAPVTDRLCDRPARTGGTDRPVTERPAGDRPTKNDLDGQAARGRSVTGDRAPRMTGAQDIERLLRIARSTLQPGRKPTRHLVAQAIRGQNVPLSSDTLTVVMSHLRPQVTTTRN